MGMRTPPPPSCRHRRGMQNGWTALIVSAQNGHLEVALLLLDSNADIHAASKVKNCSLSGYCRIAE
jgi:hypothetical protein